MDVDPGTLTLKQAALWYASMGWEIFPLKPRSKFPFKNFSWPKEASSDPAKIMFWWDRVPDANIGLHPGPSGLVVIDLDDYKEGGADLAFEDRATVTTLTGGGGEHHFYRMPEGKFYGNNRGGLQKNIDVRGYGGYVLLPPSAHPGGGVYEWEENYSPADLSPIDLPPALAEILDAACHNGDLPEVKFAAADAPDISLLRLSDDVRSYIRNGHPQYSDRSRIDHITVFALVAAGATNGEIEAIFESYPIGDRFREKRDHGRRYLSYSIAKARQTVDVDAPRVRHTDRVEDARALNHRTEVELVSDAIGFIPRDDKYVPVVVSALLAGLFPSAVVRPVGHWLALDGDGAARELIARISHSNRPAKLGDFYQLAEQNGWKQQEAELRIARQRLWGG